MTTKRRPAKKSTKVQTAAPVQSAQPSPQDLIMTPEIRPESPPKPPGSVKEPVKLNPEQVKIVNGMRDKISGMKMQIGDLAVQRAQLDARANQLADQIGQMTGMIGQTDQEIRETLFGYLREAGVDPDTEQWTFQWQTYSFVRVRLS